MCRAAQALLKNAAFVEVTLIVDALCVLDSDAGVKGAGQRQRLDIDAHRVRKLALVALLRRGQLGIGYAHCVTGGLRLLVVSVGHVLLLELFVAKEVSFPRSVVIQVQRPFSCTNHMVWYLILAYILLISD